MELTKHETLIPGEDEAIRKLGEMLKAKMIKERTADQKIIRDAHPKQILLVKGEFVIDQNLPDKFKIGVFKEERSFPCWVRFSNQSAPPAPDKVKDIRGVAIKLMEVGGNKILENEMDAKTQDFILISTNYFVTKDVVQFSGLIAALVSGFLKLGLYFFFHPKVLYNLITSNKCFGSLLEARFWSVSPYLFGDRVVKYSLIPQAREQTSVPEDPAENYLREVMAKQLEGNEYRYDFAIQFQKDEKKMQVEDLSDAWNETDSPFIKLATLKIPSQQVDNDQLEFGDNLSFSPWHCLPVHRPLGSVNRGRKVVYEMLSRFRHESNKAERFEPLDFNIKP